VLAAGLVVVSVLGYRVATKNSPALADTVAVAPAEPAPTAPTAAPAAEPGQAPSAAEGTAATPSATEAATAPSASAAEPTAAPATSAAAAAPAPSASAPAATTADIRRITVKSKPPKVRFFHFGKQVGVTPFVLEFKPGERHAYEAGLPGYGTRKVVIDGSKPEVTIGLTRLKP